MRREKSIHDIRLQRFGPKKKRKTKNKINPHGTMKTRQQVTDSHYVTHSGFYRSINTSSSYVLCRRLTSWCMTVSLQIVIVVFGLGNRTSVLQQPLHSKGLLMFIKRCIHRYDKAIIRFVTDNRLIALLMFNSLILTCYKSFGNNL